MTTVPRPEARSWAGLAGEEVEELVKSRRDGLAESEVERGRAESGPHVFEEAEPPSVLSQIWHQFQSPFPPGSGSR